MANLLEPCVVDAFDNAETLGRILHPTDCRSQPLASTRQREVLLKHPFQEVAHVLCRAGAADTLSKHTPREKGPRRSPAAHPSGLLTCRQNPSLPRPVE